jgi:hypothetical protein
MAGSASSSPTRRWVLRRTGGDSASAPDALHAHLQTLAGVQVLDASARMMLVDAPQDVLQQAVGAHQGWEMAPETITPLPDTRAKIRR